MRGSRDGIDELAPHALVRLRADVAGESGDLQAGQLVEESAARRLGVGAGRSPRPPGEAQDEPSDDSTGGEQGWPRCGRGRPGREPVDADGEGRQLRVLRRMLRPVTRKRWPCASCRTCARKASTASWMSEATGIITRATATCGGIPTWKSMSRSPDHGSCQVNWIGCRPGPKVPRRRTEPSTSSTPWSLIEAWAFSALYPSGRDKCTLVGCQAVRPKL